MMHTCTYSFGFRETKNVSDFFQKHLFLHQMSPRLQGPFFCCHEFALYGIVVEKTKKAPGV